MDELNVFRGRRNGENKYDWGIRFDVFRTFQILVDLPALPKRVVPHFRRVPKFVGWSIELDDCQNQLKFKSFMAKLFSLIFHLQYPSGRGPIPNIWSPFFGLK